MSNERRLASRIPPPKVAPVVLNSIRYAQVAGREWVDGQVGGLLAAYAAGDEMLWTLKVYDNRRQPDLEGDVQDVFFRSMSVEADGRLRIVNERGDVFLVDVNTRSVTAAGKVARVTSGEQELFAPTRISLPDQSSE